MNERQRRFVAYYVRYLQANKAAIRAGYSEKSADSTAQKLLARKEIKKAIFLKQREVLAEAKLDANWLLARLKRESEALIGDIMETITENYQDVDANGEMVMRQREREVFKYVKDWPLEWQSGLVKSMSLGADGRPDKVTLVDMTKRLELIGKHIAIGAFNPVLGMNVEGDNALIGRVTRRIIHERVISEDVLPEESPKVIEHGDQRVVLDRRGEKPN